tara:strand:+ start:14340 stop:14597 length:258 start_codon:yes stop_codon:yes gene_type:complete
METLSYEVQMALVSFAAAVLIGGPVALIGAGRVVSLARLLTRFAVKRHLTTMFVLSVLGGLGATAGGLIGLPAANPADLLASLSF